MNFIAAIQMASVADIQTNLAKAEVLIAKAAKEGAQCVVLPEEFATLGLEKKKKKVRLAEPFGEGLLQSFLSRVATQYRVWVIGGTIPLQSSDPQKAFSSTLVWDLNGQCVARYDKIHLFDVLVAEQEIYQESLCVQAGEGLCVLPTPFGKIGIAICYDVRFPELFRAMALSGVQIIVLPSAFTINTGKVHWEILLRARAIENLSYVVAANQVGIRYSGHGTYGNSMIVSPWGEIIAHQAENEGVILADIDLEQWAHYHRQFPALRHTRTSVIEAFLNETKR